MKSAMKTVILIIFTFIVLLTLVHPSFAQVNGVRWELGAPGSAGAVMINSGSGYPPIYAVPNATLSFCYYPPVLAPAPAGQTSACTNLVTTYTDLTLATACPTNAQVVLQGSSSCQTTSAADGSMGVYIAASGTYSYTLTVNGVASIPYTVTVGGNGGGGIGTVTSVTGGLGLTSTNPQPITGVGTINIDPSGTLGVTPSWSRVQTTNVNANVTPTGAGDIVLYDANGNTVDSDATGVNAAHVGSNTSYGFMSLGLNASSTNAFAALGDNVGNSILFDNPSYSANFLLSNSNRTAALINQYSSTPGSGSTTYLYGNPLYLGVNPSPGNCTPTCSTPSAGFSISVAGSPSVASEQALARFLTIPSTTSAAGLNIGQGNAPSAPVNGDIWATSTGFYGQAGGNTLNLTGFNNPLTTLGDEIVGGVNGMLTRLPGPTAPAGVPQLYTSTPTGNLATQQAWQLPGVTARYVTGTTDTILASDCTPARISYTGSGNVAVTLPNASGSSGSPVPLGVPHCVFRLANKTTGTNTALTVTPTTWTCNGSSTCTVAQGQVATFTVDAASSTNWLMDPGEQTVTGGSGVTVTRSSSGISLAATAASNWYAPGTDSGSVNAYVVTSAMTSYVAGNAQCFIVTHNNTTTAPTVNFASLGAKTIVRFGSNILSAGDMTTGGESCLVYDGTNFDLLNPAANTGAGKIVNQSNPAITGPSITTGFNDANGNQMIYFTPTASAVDGITVTNAATANPATVTIAATGSDSNINIAATPKGTGVLDVGGGVVIGTATCTTFGSAGGICPAEGTAPTNVSGAAPLYPDSTAHEYLAATNGSSSFGMMVRTRPSAIHLTGQTASISTATLCAASAGACNVAGQYHIHFDFIETGTACSNVSSGSTVTFALTYTDTNGTTHSALIVPMLNQTSATAVALGNSFTFATALANAGASGDITISTNGSVIQYATTYSACNTGTGTYQLDASVTRLQ